MVQKQEVLVAYSYKQGGDESIQMTFNKSTLEIGFRIEGCLYASFNLNHPSELAGILNCTQEIIDSIEGDADEC